MNQERTELGITAVCIAIDEIFQSGLYPEYASVEEIRLKISKDSEVAKAVIAALGSRVAEFVFEKQEADKPRIIL